MGSKLPQYPPTRQFLPDGSPNPNYVAGFIKPNPSPPPPPPRRPSTVTIVHHVIHHAGNHHETKR